MSDENERQKKEDEVFCSSCGAIIKKEAEICPKCGVRQKAPPSFLSGFNPKEQATSLLGIMIANRKMIVNIVGIVLCLLFFVAPLVQCSQDSSITATGLEISIGTGKLMDNAERAYPYVFVLLIFPVVLVLLGITNKSFKALRNVSIVGLMAHIAFTIHALIMSNTGDFDGTFELTGFNWLIIAIYIGLIIFLVHCIKIEAPSGKPQAEHPDRYKPKKNVYAIASLILGISGAICLLVVVLTLVYRGIFKISIEGIRSIIEIVLYGLLAGVICQGFIRKTTEKTILKNSGIVFLVTLLLGIVTRIIVEIGYFLYSMSRYYFDTGVLFRLIGRNIGANSLFGLKQGLAAGIICAASVFVFLKLNQKKGILPFGKTDKTFLEESKLNFYRKIVGVCAFVLCVLFFVLPLEKYPSSISSSGLNYSTHTGWGYVNWSRGSPVMILMLIFPLALAVLAFIKRSFKIICAASVACLIGEIIILIAMYSLSSAPERITVFNWILLLIYIELFAFTFYCVIKTKGKDTKQQTE